MSELDLLGRLMPYLEDADESLGAWGSVYLESQRRTGRPRPLHPGPCPFCNIASGQTYQGTARVVTFKGNEYVIVANFNPIVNGQILVFPLAHRVDLIEPDIHLIAALLRDPRCGHKEEGPHKKSIEELWNQVEVVRQSADGDVSVEDTKYQWAVYINAFPGTGRSVPHLHINAVPSRRIPSFNVGPVPWELAYHKDHHTVITRLADKFPFYGLVFMSYPEKISRRDAQSLDGLARAMVEFHGSMNTWEVPYNLLAYSENDENSAGVISLVAIPRQHEYCQAADQKIAGFEFLTGILIPGHAKRPDFDRRQRDRAFAQATLNTETQLHLERLLRYNFGIPAFGRGYDTRLKSIPEKWELQQKSNVAIPNYREAVLYWVKGKVTDVLRAMNIESSNEPDLSSDKPCVLFRIRSAIMVSNESSSTAVCSLLCAGGYVVDPGPYAKLSAGQKAAILPGLVCGQCVPCTEGRLTECERRQTIPQGMWEPLPELLSVPSGLLWSVPDALSDEALPFIQPLASAFRRMFQLRGGNDVWEEIEGDGIEDIFANAVVRQFWPKRATAKANPPKAKGEFCRSIFTPTDVSRAVAELTQRWEFYKDACDCAWDYYSWPSVEKIFLLKIRSF